MNEQFKSLSLDLKAVESDNPNGEFEAILSTPDVDREGETIAPGAFNPLPKSIPIHFAHDFVDKVPPIGRGVPFYDGDTLKVRGTFASTPRAQELRSLVNEGVVDCMSAGFITTKRKGKSVTGADLIEGSLTATPVNRSALLLRSKALEDLGVKAGARNSASDAAMIQKAHDLMSSLGADCMGTKAVADMGEADDTVPGLLQAIDAALDEAAAAWADDPDQAMALITSARASVDAALALAGVPDADEQAGKSINESLAEATAPAAAADLKSAAAAEAAAEADEADIALRGRLLAIDAAVAAV